MASSISIVAFSTAAFSMMAHATSKLSAKVKMAACSAVFYKEILDIGATLIYFPFHLPHSSHVI
jgi:hypothetical protein